MKKINLLLVFAILPFFGISQSLFDKYEDMEHISSISINQNMINFVSSINSDDIDKETKEFLDMAKGIKSLKVFITEDEAVATDMLATVTKYLRTSKLEELMRVKDKDINVKFYVKEGRNDDHVEELLMLVSGFDKENVKLNGRSLETVLLTITGDIDLTKIGSLTKKMNLPKELNKAQKSK